MRTIDVFKLNQLLFLEAGFIHLNSLLSGMFIPLWGITFLFVAVATYFVFCFMGTILAHQNMVFEDFVDVAGAEEFPSSGKNIIYVVGAMFSTIPIVIFYNLDLVVYPVNSTLCTLAASTVGCLAYILATNNGVRAVALLAFSLFSIPITVFSLIAGAIVTLPWSFIYFYLRT